MSAEDFLEDKKLNKVVGASFIRNNLDAIKFQKAVSAAGTEDSIRSDIRGILASDFGEMSPEVEGALNAYTEIAIEKAEKGGQDLKVSQVLEDLDLSGLTDAERDQATMNFIDDGFLKSIKKGEVGEDSMWGAQDTAFQKSFAQSDKAKIIEFEVMSKLSSIINEDGIKTRG